MKVRETTREDGLRIISAKTKSEKVYLELIADVGSAYDPPDKYGLFHFFEHLAFGDTKSRSRAEINSYLARYTLDSGAFTDKLITVYNGSAVPKKFDRLCTILSDIYFNSSVSRENVEREREVILNEIAAYNDGDSNKAFRTMYELFWENNPMRRWGAGTSETIQNITLTDLLAAQTKYYIAANTIIIAVGAINHEDLVSEFNSRIPIDGPNVKEHSRIWDDEYASTPGLKSKTVELPGREKAIILVGCKIPFAQSEKEHMIERCLQYLLVGRYNSRLWHEIQEKRGLVYSLSGELTGIYPLGGYFYIYAETLPHRIDSVHDLIKELLELPFTGNDFDRLEETREWLSDWYSLNSSGLDHSAFARLIRSKLAKSEDPKRTERYYMRQRKNIMNTSLEEIENLRSAILKPDKFVTVVAKPI